MVDTSDSGGVRTRDHRPGRTAKATSLVAVLTACGLMLAACGSSSSSSSSSASSKSFNLASYKAAVKAFESSTTKWPGPTRSFKAPRHEKLAIISCMAALQGCQETANAAADAARLLGWSVTVYDGQGIPSTQNGLVETAVASGVNGIITTSISPASIAGGLAAARAANIPVGSIQQGVSPSPTGFKFDIGTNWGTVGRAQGDWVIANSQGKAIVGVYQDKEYTSVEQSVNSFIKTIKGCSTCKLLPTQQFVGADVGTTLGTSVVGFVNAHPTVQYILGVYDPAALNISSSLFAAGLTKVKVVSQIGDSANIAFIREGGHCEAADVAFDQQYTGYAAIDQMARLLAHVPMWKTPGVSGEYTYAENPPMKLLVKGDLPKSGVNWTAPIGTVAHFKKLWGLG